MTRYIFFLLLFSTHLLLAQGDLSWSGIVNTPTGDPLGNVTLSLADTSGATVASQIVDCDGVFSLEGLNASTDYTLSISHNGNSLNGVSTFDMVLISKHMLGTQLFSDPYKVLAADVEGSGTITILDLVLIRAMILGMLENFPDGAWHFVESGTTISPNGSTINLTESINNVQFIGVKKADVNASMIPCE